MLLVVVVSVVIEFDIPLSVVVVVVSVVVLVSLVVALGEQAAMLRAATAAPARASLRRTVEVMSWVPLRWLERGVANLTAQTRYGCGREPAALLQYATPR